jgi:transposase-like protein
MEVRNHRSKLSQKKRKVGAKKRALELYRKGYSLEEIALEMGEKRDKVWTWIKEFK